MIGEVATATAKVVEVTAKATEIVAKEAAKETAKDVGKAALEKSVDITKRIDVTKNATSLKQETVDITKRINPDKNVTGTDLGKELKPKQIKDLINNGMSPGIVKDCTIKNDVVHLKTVNEKFADSVQPESGVSYVKKTIDLFGTKVEGVFPKFDAAYTTKLPADKLMASDKVQFDHCVDQLKKDISKNPSLKEKFTPRQLEQIMNGKTPGGYTWHHNEEVGKMELVDTATHDKAKHTGGKAIWGGGKDFR